MFSWSSTKNLDVISYLNAPNAPEACTNCVPMTGLMKVSPGVQLDGGAHLERLHLQAIAWLSKRSSEIDF